MNFVKGMIVGTCIPVVAYMLYSETSHTEMKKLMKKGKKFIKKCQN